VLALYQTRTLRLLHDSLQQFYQSPELNDYINQSRQRIAADTKCLRQLITSIPLVSQQELYNIMTTVNTGTPANLGAQVLEVISVTIYWGTQRVILQNRSFSEQNAKLRIWQSYTTRPGSIARMGANQLYINPTPDQAYVSDWDCVITPTPLALDTDPEVLAVPFQNLVPYYAAHLAKYNMEAFGEAQIFYEKYLVERQAAMWAFTSARVRDYYRR
jgi:hypothetical protein